MKVSFDLVVLGAIQGLLYGALAVGLVLIYRAQRFVNFAQANLGLISSVLLSKLVLDAGMPYWGALPVALAAGVLLAAATELTVVRRLFQAPRLVLMVASIFLSQLFLLPRLIQGLNPERSKLVTEGFPVPFEAEVTIGGLVLRAPDLMVLALVPLMVAALGVFLRRSAYGQAIRAAADNPDAARLAGISVRRMSTVVWIIAGLLSALAAILAAPRAGVFAFGGSGASILVRALAAALFGRMTSMPLAFGAAVGIGVVEAVAFANYPNGGVVELLVFVLVMAALLLRARELGKSTRDASSGLNFGAEPAPLRPELAALRVVKRLRLAILLSSCAAAAVLPLLPVFGLNTHAKIFLMTVVLTYCLVGISLCLLTGWGGQVSLGQFAFVGVGSFGAARLVELLSAPAWAVLPLAALVGAVVAVVVGLPAVRIQGLFLTVSTVSFAVLAHGFLFQQERIVGNPQGMFLERPSYLRSDRTLYYVGVALVISAALMVRNFRRTAGGRMLIAVRDNDIAARANGVSATATRLFAFAVSGMLCACAGVLYGYAITRFTATSFDPDLSFAMVTMTVVGGLGTLSGALLGPIFVYGIPVLLQGSNLTQFGQLLISGLGGLVVLVFLPRGLAGIAFDVRDAFVARLTRVPDTISSRPTLRQLWAAARGRPTGVAGVEEQGLVLEGSGV